MVRLSSGPTSKVLHLLKALGGEVLAMGMAGSLVQNEIYVWYEASMIWTRNDFLKLVPTQNNVRI